MSDEERLYGRPGAENLQLDIASVWESEIDGQYDESDPEWAEGWVIEEWTIESDASRAKRFPSPATIIGRIHEDFCDDYGAEVDPLEDIEEDEAAIAAAQALLDIFVKASAGWRWADKKVGEHRITMVGEGETAEPYLDGEPMYVKRIDPGEGMLA